MSGRTRSASRTGVTILVASMTLLWGCESSPVTEPTDSTRVRFANLSQDHPSVDVWLASDSLLVSDVAFPGVSGYVDVPVGLVDIGIGLAGEDVSFTEGIVVTQRRTYTVVLHSALGEPSVLAFVDDDRVVSESRLRVRAMNVSPDLGEVDLWSIPEGGGASALFRDLAPAEISGTIELPAVGYQLGLDVDDDEVMEALFEVPDMAPGQLSYVFVGTDASGEPFLLLQAQQGVEVRIDPKQ